MSSHYPSGENIPVVDLTQSSVNNFKASFSPQECSDEESDSSDSLPSVFGDISNKLPSMVRPGSHRNRVVPSLFSGKETQHVSALPLNIDGDQVYKLSYNASNPALSTSDGRPWNAYFNSKRSGFSGIRRRASC